ncbi:hypothetical protein ACP70R_025317 [Stipagrostis hirtigluma subsp. patula]
MYSLRVATSGGSSGLGFALGRLGGRRASGGVSAAPAGSVPPASSRGRSVSATPATNAPLPGDQGVGMEQPKQQKPQPPRQDAAAREEEGKGNTRDDMHKTTGDVMTHSFGEGYSTRSDEEGFGGVYGGNDPVEHPGTEIHPNHPEYDTSQGSEVKEKEKARNLKDATHAV